MRRRVGSCAVVDASKSGFGDVVEDTLEIVQENGIGGAFEDKRKLTQQTKINSLAYMHSLFGRDSGQTYPPEGINPTLF